MGDINLYVSCIVVRHVLIVWVLRLYIMANNQPMPEVIELATYNSYRYPSLSKVYSNDE